MALDYLPPQSPQGTPQNASSANAAATNTLTFAATAARTNYVSGFTITGAGATGASNIAITLSGVVGGPLNYVIAIPAGVTTGFVPLSVAFFPPLIATGANVAITLTVPSFGAGNTNAAANMQGFQI